MRSILSKSKKGQVTNLISGTVIGFLVLVLTIMAVLFGISALKPSTFFGSGTAEANATQTLTQNLTTGVAQFGGYIPTVFTVLGVVLAISAVVVLILYVRRIQVGGSGSL